MTTDPGSYDLTPADLALAREDAADERVVDLRRETLADRGIHGDYLTPGEYAAARPSRAVVSLLALNHALDRTQEALGLPPGRLTRDIVEHAAAKDHALAQAVTAWREVDRYEAHDSQPWWDAIRRLRDAADRYAGVGIGQPGSGWRGGAA